MMCTEMPNILVVILTDSWWQCGLCLIKLVLSGHFALSRFAQLLHPPDVLVV